MAMRVWGKSGGSGWKSPGRRGFSGTRRFAASRRAEPQARCVGEARRVLGREGGLREGGLGGREALWDGGNGALGCLRAGFRDGSGRVVG